jgi:hypothetical protein
MQQLRLGRIAARAHPGTWSVASWCTATASSRPLDRVRAAGDGVAHDHERVSREMMRERISRPRKSDQPSVVLTPG